MLPELLRPLQRGQQVKAGVRGPAIVTEFLSQGSVRGVLARKSDVISGALVRVLIAMDAAKVRNFAATAAPSGCQHAHVQASPSAAAFWACPAPAASDLHAAQPPNQLTCPAFS